MFLTVYVVKSIQWTGASVNLRFISADLEWKLTYVGSAESEKYDQELDSVLVGPVVRGQYRFIFQVIIEELQLLKTMSLCTTAVLCLKRFKTQPAPAFRGAPIHGRRFFTLIVV